MNSLISRVSQCERVLRAAVAAVAAADYAKPDDETVHVSDEALDDFLSGGAIPE